MCETPSKNRSWASKGKDADILSGGPHVGLKGARLRDQLLKRHFRPPHPLGYWFFVIFLSGLSGCAALFSPPNAPPPVQHYSETELISLRLTRESLKSGGLAVLAVLSPRAPEGMQQNAAYEIFQGLRSSFPEVHIIPRSDAVGKIVSADQLPAYKAFVKDYEEKRKMNLDALKKWGEVEGVRYLFIGELGVADKHTEARIMRGGEDMVGGKISVFASGPNMIPEEVRKQVRLRGELWDSRCGQAVWIGKGEAEVAETAGQEQARMEDVFISAARNLTFSLSKSIEKNPPPAKECP